GECSDEHRAEREQAIPEIEQISPQQRSCRQRYSIPATPAVLRGGHVTLRGEERIPERGPLVPQQEQHRTERAGREPCGISDTGNGASALPPSRECPESKRDNERRAAIIAQNRKTQHRTGACERSITRRPRRASVLARIGPRARKQHERNQRTVSNDRILVQECGPKEDRRTECIEQ